MMNEKTENITIGDCIRAMNDEQLADLYVAATESAMKVVLGKHGITYEKANLDKEELKKLMLDMLKKNASDFGKAEKERNF